METSWTVLSSPKFWRGQGAASQDAVLEDEAGGPVMTGKLRKQVGLQRVISRIRREAPW